MIEILITHNDGDRKVKTRSTIDEALEFVRNFYYGNPDVTSFTLVLVPDDRRALREDYRDERH